MFISSERIVKHVKPTQKINYFVHATIFTMRTTPKRYVSKTFLITKILLCITKFLCAYNYLPRDNNTNEVTNTKYENKLLKKSNLALYLFY